MICLKNVEELQTNHSLLCAQKDTRINSQTIYLSTRKIKDDKKRTSMDVLRTNPIKLT